MPLIEELNKQGNILFNYRSFLPIPFMIIALLIYIYNIDLEQEEKSLIFETSCLLVGLLGQIIRAITIGYAPHGTSGRNTNKQIADELNTKGMYSLVRNPLYLGNFFMWFSIVLFVDLIWLNLLYIICFWIYYERIIFAEENFLRKKYADLYLKWANNTPIFIPRLNGWKTPDMNFSLKNILKREYSGFFALFLCFSLLNIAEIYTRYNLLKLDNFWAYALLISGGAALMLKIFKKKQTSYI